MLAKLLAGAGGNSARALPSFVSSSINRVTTADNTVTAPSNIQNGDLLVAVGFNVVNGLTITPPTGFNVQFFDGTADNTFFIATKAASGESGNYTWTWSTSGNNTVAMLVYRDATVVNTIGTLTRAASTNGVAASITPTYAGTLAAVFCIEGGTKTVATPPSGMTQRASNAGSAPCLEVYDLASQPASATSSKTLVWSASDTLASIQFFITNEPDVAPVFVASATQASNANSITINKPTGTIEGDLMVATVNAGSNSPVYTAPAGWTTVADAGGTNPCTIVAYKTAGASEPASYTFTASKTQNNSGAIVTYRYAAYDTIAAGFNTSANPLVLASISPSSSQSLLLAIAARSAGSVTLTTPTSMNAVVTDADATAPSYIVCDQKVAKGPTGTRSTTTGSTASVAGIMLAIKPTRSL